jgi:hypothetical protein
MRQLAARLSYANVMATIAVFIALGAGAYAVTKAPRNSVVSSSIKNGQVKPPDLSSTTRAVAFRYSKPIGSTIQTTVLRKGGYRLVASCENDSGQPAIDVSLRVPKSGTLDVMAVQDPGAAVATPIAGRRPAPANTDLDLFDPPFGPATDTDDSFGALLTYSAPGRAAQLSFHVVAAGSTDRCELSGGLVPLN